MALTLAPVVPAAAAQDGTAGWKRFVNKEGITILVDPASVTRSGTARSLRAQISKDGDSHSAVVKITVDCGVPALTIVGGETFDNGVRIGTVPERPAPITVKGDNASEAIVAFVCADARDGN